MSNDIYSTYMKQAPSRGLDDMRQYIRCECGRELRATRTECDQCGAHYREHEDGMEQIVPPIESRLPMENGDNDTDDD